MERDALFARCRKEEEAHEKSNQWRGSASCSQVASALSFIIDKGDSKRPPGRRMYDMHGAHVYMRQYNDSTMLTILGNEKYS
jgi:hypothetical protein